MHRLMILNKKYFKNEAMVLINILLKKQNHATLG